MVDKAGENLREEKGKSRLFEFLIVIRTPRLESGSMFLQTLGPWTWPSRDLPSCFHQTSFATLVYEQHQVNAKTARIRACRLIGGKDVFTLQLMAQRSKPARPRCFNPFISSDLAVSTSCMSTYSKPEFREFQCFVGSEQRCPRRRAFEM